MSQLVFKALAHSLRIRVPDVLWHRELGLKDPATLDTPDSARDLLHHLVSVKDLLEPLELRGNEVAN
jgi:hypothetical protein